MFQLNFKQRMGIVIAVQVLFVILILVLIGASLKNLNNISDSQKSFQNELNSSFKFVFDIQNYLGRHNSFKNLESQKAILFTGDFQKDFEKEINDLWSDVQKINNYRIENINIEKEIYELTNQSIVQSNKYIFDTSQRLADPQKKNRVSTIERLVIGGALTNTISSYKIREEFEKIKKDITLQEKYLSFIETLIAGASEDIKNLKGTMFAQLPVEALKVNLKMKELSLSFIKNIELQNKQVEKINNALNGFVNHIQNESNKNTNSLFKSLKSLSLTIYFILIIISIFAIILSVRSLRRMYNQIGTSPDEIEQIALDISLGKLKSNIDIRNTKGVHNSIIEMNNRIVKIVQSIIESTSSIALSSNEMKVNVQQVSQGASEQAASTEEVSATMEEMTANIERGKDGAQTTESIIKKTAESIKLSNTKMMATIDAMKKIAEKVKIINDIAFQTNILAINASIEASNAGEYGKGFSVVAKEVGKLAEHSKLAAIEIEELSNSSVQKALESGDILEKLLPEVENTVTLISEVSSSSVEQYSGAQQINNSIQQLNDITQVNAAASEEISASIIELAQHAEDLKELASLFKVTN